MSCLSFPRCGRCITPFTSLSWKYYYRCCCCCCCYRPQNIIKFSLQILLLFLLPSIISKLLLKENVNACAIMLGRRISIFSGKKEKKKVICLCFNYAFRFIDLQNYCIQTNFHQMNVFYNWLFVIYSSYLGWKAGNFICILFGVRLMGVSYVSTFPKRIINAN